MASIHRRNRVKTKMSGEAYGMRLILVIAIMVNEAVNWNAKWQKSCIKQKKIKKDIVTVPEISSRGGKKMDGYISDYM